MGESVEFSLVDDHSGASAACFSSLLFFPLRYKLPCGGLGGTAGGFPPAPPGRSSSFYFSVCLFCRVYCQAASEGWFSTGSVSLVTDAVAWLIIGRHWQPRRRGLLWIQCSWAQLLLTAVWTDWKNNTFAVTQPRHFRNYSNDIGRNRRLGRPQLFNYSKASIATEITEIVLHSFIFWRDTASIAHIAWHTQNHEKNRMSFDSVNEITSIGMCFRECKGQCREQCLNVVRRRYRP